MPGDLLSSLPASFIFCPPRGTGEETGSEVPGQEALLSATSPYSRAHKYEEKGQKGGKDRS